MLIALVTSLIVLLGGGPDTFFLVPKGQKKIKTHVVDQDKAKEATAHFKAANKAIKTFNKQNKKDRKELVKLQADRQTSRETLKVIYANAVSARKQLQEDMADTRLKIRDLMTEEEWDAFIVDALAELEKKEKKTQKQDVKAENTAQKNLDKIGATISQEVQDEERRKEALEAFSNFETNMMKLVEETSALKFDTNEALQSYATSREALMEIYDEMNVAQDEAFETFLDMRDELINDTSDEEWKAISKSLKKVF